MSPGPLFAVALAAATIIGPLAIHLFLPALPAVKAAFGISDAVAQLTLSITLFAMAFLTLVYGSLSDRYGRRRVLLWSMALFVVGTLATLVADDIVLFILGRLLQAAGAAGGGALSRAIARDVYGSDKLVKVLAYLTMAYTLGPMLAPPIGGFLVDRLGWQAIFVFALALGCVIAGLSYFIIFETHKPHPVPGALRHMLAGYGALFSSLRFNGFVLQSGFSTGAFFSIAVSATYLMRDNLGRSATEYGLFFLAFPIGFSSGNFISSRLSGRVPIEKMVLIGALTAIATVATQDALVLSGVVNPWTLFIPGGIVTFAQGLSLPNAQSGAMAVVPRYAGTAAGVGGFMSLFAAALFTELVGIFADGTPMPMIALATSASVLSLVSALMSFSTRKQPVPAVS
jgi:DHA1 family bicyclomycin/chloramphenicol resistance-like MFS transporter